MNSIKTSKINSDYLWLILIIIAGLLLRAAAITWVSSPPVSDQLAYKSMALNLVSGNVIADGMGNRAMYNIGYPIFVLSPVFFFFGEDLLVVRLYNLVLGGIAIFLCYVVAKEAGAGRGGRLFAAALWAFYLPASVFCTYLNKENLMTPLMLGVMWCALRLEKTPSSKVAMGCGLLFGLLALTGNAALSLTGVILLALILSPTSVRRRITLSMLILAVTIIVSTPWMVRNMRVIGSPVLNTNGGFNLYLGNNPAATGMFISIADTPRGPTWNALRKTGEVKASETLKEEAVAWIKAHPTEFLSLAFKKLVYFWMPPFHTGEGGNKSTAETIVRVMWAIQFCVLVVAAISSLVFSTLRNRQLVMLWLGVACYTAVHMLFYVIFRYREPIMPLICVIAAFTIEYLFIKKGISWGSQETA